MPAPSIGFLLLTHDKPERVLRLARRLNALFDTPPIACHHDFHQSPLDTSLFPPNVTFLSPHRITGWGTFNVTAVTFKGLAALASRPDAPEWYIPLSGADYPVVPPDVVRRDLAAATVDAFLNCKHIHPKYPRDGEQVEYARRYLRLRIPVWGRQVPLGRFPLPFWLTRQFTVWRGSFECYAGSQWMTLRRNAVEGLLEFCDRNPKILRFLSGTPCVDEVIPQTVLCNIPGLKVCTTNNYRHIVMSPKNATVMRMKDLPAIRASGAHFTRKVDADVDAELIEALDAICDGAPVPAR